VRISLSYTGYIKILYSLFSVNELNKSEADYKEAWDCWGPDMFNAKGFPTEVAELKDSVNTFRQSLVLLCKKLFFCFGKYLNLEDPEFFLKRHRALEDPSVLSHNVVRTNYYMPLKSLDGISENTMRLGEHNDWGSVTFLIQDSAGGLEASNGVMIEVLCRILSRFR
jgi:isopenicillin N synthase-like dioxygenase